MRAIDTNVLIRLLTRDDAKQTLAATQFAEAGAWVSHLVLMETVWVLSSVYKVQPKRIATAIEMLLEHQHLILQDPDVIAKALAHFRKQPTLGFSDCLILEVARSAGHEPLGTFDHRLAKLPGTNKL